MLHPKLLLILLSKYSKNLPAVYHLHDCMQRNSPCFPEVKPHISVSSLFLFLWHISTSFTPGWSILQGFPGGSEGKESAFNVGDLDSVSGSGGSPGEGNGYPLQYSCLENPHGQRSLVGYSPQGHKELDTTEAHMHIANLQCCVNLCWFRYIYIYSFPLWFIREYLI